MVYYNADFTRRSNTYPPSPSAFRRTRFSLNPPTSFFLMLRPIFFPSSFPSFPPPALSERGYFYRLRYLRFRPRHSAFAPPSRLLSVFSSPDPSRNRAHLSFSRLRPLSSVPLRFPPHPFFSPSADIFFLILRPIFFSSSFSSFPHPPPPTAVTFTASVFLASARGTLPFLFLFPMLSAFSSPDPSRNPRIFSFSRLLSLFLSAIRDVFPFLPSGLPASPFPPLSAAPAFLSIRRHLFPHTPTDLFFLFFSVSRIGLPLLSPPSPSNPFLFPIFPDFFLAF